MPSSELASSREVALMLKAVFYFVVGIIERVEDFISRRLFPEEF